MLGRFGSVPQDDCCIYDMNAEFKTAAFLVITDQELW